MGIVQGDARQLDEVEGHIAITSNKMVPKKTHLKNSTAVPLSKNHHPGQLRLDLR